MEPAIIESTEPALCFYMLAVNVHLFFGLSGRLVSLVSLCGV